MSYDEGLQVRIESVLKTKISYECKKMFGGICFLLNGNMLGGIINDQLIIRAGTKKYDELLRLENTRVFDITGRIMKGWILIDQLGLDSEQKLRSWLDIGIDYAASLPPK